ncbi:HupE/UreJ family protein [Bythopirellula goksoeyrii]|uniref:HupE / UreJ protein n=1 Tax=Bythopirellula goksoeyrii TaxID=1400387 RepID=A0A5B9Q5T4_9BACT|nr:HupE/UreJ family protein [Bythopirellula goksoeyrii]QEG34388.1 hypothetical protein Pr1d_16640 [Bythopirellula goksoeyrii]
MKYLFASLFFVIELMCATAFAHKPSDSYLTITGGEEYLTIEWDIALKDLEFLIGLDENQNGEITWGEVKARRKAVTAHALSRLQISHRGYDCQLKLLDVLATRHSDGGYVVLSLSTDCPGDAAELTIHYNLLFDVDPTHRGLVHYTNGEIDSTYVLSPESPLLELKTGEVNRWNSFVAYVEEGIWHIWIGYDHILFLLTLLIPAVLIRRDHQWQPVESFRPAWTSVLKIVTMFTIAHSLTLWLAVMEYVTLPGWIVEAAIAFSIIVTALNNLFPVLHLSGWAIAFGFGLIHGFGFANVLIDLGLSSVSLGIALLGFNVGVELGQLAIVAVFLPLAYLMRSTTFYRWAILRCGSILVAVIAAIWMYERIFNATIVGL